MSWKNGQGIFLDVHVIAMSTKQEDLLNRIAGRQMAIFCAPATYIEDPQ